MTIFESIILGIVEGLTEFLPVSSTGHLILTSQVLGIPQTEFLKTFEIAIQLGAIFAVIVLYWRYFFDIAILKRLAVGFAPTGLIGITVYPIVKEYLIGNEIVVLIALIAGGAALIMFERRYAEDAAGVGDSAEISLGQAAIIGLCQSVAMIPGVSRSAAAIVGGLLLGIKRTAIVEFAFLLAVPTMLAATGYDVFRNIEYIAAEELMLLAVGAATAFGVALLAIKLLLSYVRSHSFTPFGVYRIVVAVLFFVFVFVL